MFSKILMMKEFEKHQVIPTTINDTFRIEKGYKQRW